MPAGRADDPAREGRWPVAGAAVAGWTEHEGGRLAGRAGSARRAIEVREKRVRVLSRQVWLVNRMRCETASGRPRRR